MMKTISIDVMVEGGYYGNLKVKVGNIFKTRNQEITEALYKRFPTLKYRKDVMLIADN